MKIIDVSRSEGGNELYITDADRNRYKITLSDFRRLGLPDPENAGAYPTVIDDERAEELEICSDKLRGVKYMQHYLADYGDKSEKQMSDKLREKGYSEESIAGAMALLVKFGVVNEVEFCKRKIESSARAKLYGRYRIRTELMTKGYLRRSIDTAFEETEVDFFENAAKMYAKLTRSGAPKDAAEKKKIADKMVRYGYTYEEIRYASQVEYDGDPDEDNHIGLDF